MSLTTIIIIVGILAIGALGMASRRRQKSASHWVVGKRDIPKWTTWFLQAGESLTTFSFLGLAGIAFGGGVSAVYAVGYLTMCWSINYFVQPRVRELAQRRGYLTMADYFEDRFSARWLSKVVAVIGALTLIPYLQLQITGLGMIVELATGSSGARGLSMVVASILVALFVAWSGIKGIARVAILKDILMAIALVVVIAAVAISFNGISPVFTEIADKTPTLFTLHAKGYGTTWFVTSMLVTTIGAGFATLPHLWPPMLAAKSGEVLRSNAKWLPIYQLLLFIPIMVGMAAVVRLPKETEGNAVLLTMTGGIVPGWLLGIIAVGGAAAAMVPAAGIVMGISTLVSTNVLQNVRPARKMVINYVVIVVALGLALAFGLVRSDIGALLLLTYGGTTQLAPGIAIALARRVKVGAWPVGLGIIVGVVSVLLITFGNIPTGGIDSGLISLVPNLLVLIVAEAIRRARGGKDVAQVEFDDGAAIPAAR